jgi:CheY-like chemotaxis protein
MGSTSSKVSRRELPQKSSLRHQSGAEKAARYALVVDDDVDFCTIMREMLRWRGFEAQIAYSAADAWHSLGEIDPDVMLIDIAMPDVDGLELVRELRSDENYAETPIIMVTAQAIRDMLEISRKAGADFFLTKPVSIFELARTIDKLM